MKTVKEIGDDIVASLIIRLEGDEGVQKILQEWANSIIEECAGNFECSMEKCVEGDWYEQMYADTDGDYVYPVLHRGSILEVKKKL